MTHTIDFKVPAGDGTQYAYIDNLSLLQTGV
jgi:hypothetical protein